MHLVATSCREVDLALSSEGPQTQQGLKGQSINEEWEAVRDTNSPTGKDKDSEEEGGTTQVTPANLAYSENTFEARCCFQMCIWNFITAYGNSIHHSPAISCTCNQITNSTPKNTCEFTYSLDRP